MKNVILCSFFLLFTHLVSAQQISFQDLPDTVWVAVSVNAPAHAAGLEQGLLQSVEEEFSKANGLEKHPIKFMLTPDTAFADMHLQVVSCLLPTNSDKTNAVLMTAVGIAAPIALAAAGIPCPVAFYRAPRNSYYTSVSYSEYLQSLGFENEHELLRKVNTSPTASDERNEAKIADDFGSWMSWVSKEWNHFHRKALKRQGATPANLALSENE